jgi:RecA-family ATPase
VSLKLADYAGDTPPTAEDPQAREALEKTKPKFRTFDLDDLASLPEPEWLIEGVAPAHSVTTLYGPSGIGKSFLILDWALCIAAGLSWGGRPVKEGSVLYVVAEGLDGFYQRVEAWMHTHPDADRRKVRKNFRAIPRAVHFFDDEHVAAIRNTVEDFENLQLVVIDTLDRAFAGMGNENSAQDVGRFISVCDQLKRLSGATVLVVHHTGKDGKVERGGVGLRGNSDCVLAFKPHQGSLVLFCDKQKNSAEFKPIAMSLRQAAQSAVLDQVALVVSSGKSTYGVREQNSSPFAATASGPWF